MVENPHSQEAFKMTPIAYTLLEREDGKILLMRRTSGRLSLPAGHVEAGERVETTAARESWEELGIVIATSDLKLAHTVHLKDPDGQRVGFFLRAKKWSGEPKNQEPDECDGLQWASIDDLPEDTNQHITLALQNMRKGVPLTEYGWESSRVKSVSYKKTVKPKEKSDDEEVKDEAKIEMSEETGKVLKVALEEAQRLSHNYIGTEHLLLAFTRMKSETKVKKFLIDCIITEKRVRERVNSIVGQGDPLYKLDEITFAPRAQEAINTGMYFARLFGKRNLEPEHILLAMIEDGEGIGNMIMKELGFEFSPKAKKFKASLRS